jgi:exodeoxyribonuclease VII large subunit
VQSLLNFESVLNRTAIELQQIVQKRLMNETLKLDNLFNRFNFAISSAIRFEQRNLDILENKLELLLPEHTLKRGFAMIYDESGMPLRSISEISENQQLILKLSDGEIVVRVERI